MFHFPCLGSQQAFSLFHHVLPELRPDSHSTRPNTLLLTYLLKSSDAFQNAGMTCFFAQLYGMVLKVATILTWPQNGGHIWVATAQSRDKLLCSAALITSTVPLRSFCNTVKTSLRQKSSLSGGRHFVPPQKNGWDKMAAAFRSSLGSPGTHDLPSFYNMRSG